MHKEINLIMIGDGSVGKTCIIRVFTGKGFSPNSIVTLGLDCVTRKLKPPSNPTDLLTVNFWDTAGLERYGTLP